MPATLPPGSPLAPLARPARGLSFWSFIVLMLALTGLFIVLGTWQLSRLHEKEALIAAVDARIDQTPIPLPPADEWRSIDPERWNFQPVTITGRFAPEDTIFVFTNLSSPRGKYGGAGYWVITPFTVEAGGTVFINRGFVPQDLAATFEEDISSSPDTVTVTGLARAPEKPNDFTPAPDRANRIEWVRDPARFAALSDAALGPFLDLNIDLPAEAPGVLPQGGETVISFSNRHLEYAGTWYLFAIITPLMLVVWIRRQRRPGPPPSTGADAQR